MTNCPCRTVQAIRGSDSSASSTRLMFNREVRPRPPPPPHTKTIATAPPSFPAPRTWNSSCRIHAVLSSSDRRPSPCTRTGLAEQSFMWIDFAKRFCSFVRPGILFLGQRFSHATLRGSLGCLARRVQTADFTPAMPLPRQCLESGLVLVLRPVDGGDFGCRCCRGHGGATFSRIAKPGPLAVKLEGCLHCT